MRAKTGGALDLHPGEDFIALALVTGSSVAKHTLAADCTIFGTDGQVIRHTGNCLGETESSPQFPDAAVLILFATNYPDKAIAGVHKIQAHIRDNSKGQIATIEGQIRVTPAATTPQAEQKPAASVAPQPAHAEPNQEIIDKRAQADLHFIDAVRAMEKDPKKAIDEFRAAAQLYPDPAYAHERLGQAFELEGNLQAALIEFDKARKLRPQDSDFQANYQRVSNAIARSSPSATAAGVATSANDSDETDDQFGYHKNRLEGIYVGNDDGVAQWYHFGPAGAVAWQCSQLFMPRPDTVMGWQTYRVSADPDPRNHFLRRFGRYQISGETLTVVVQMFAVDQRRQAKLVETLFASSSQPQTEVHRLTLLRGFDVVRRDGLVLVRQWIESKRMLSGRFHCMAVTTTSMSSGAATFTADGHFSMQMDQAYTGGLASVPGGGNTANGNYDIQENGSQGINLYLWNAVDQKISNQNFGYLGKDREGREYIAIGDCVWRQELPAQ